MLLEPLIAYCISVGLSPRKVAFHVVSEPSVSR